MRRFGGVLKKRLTALLLSLALTFGCLPAAADGEEFLLMLLHQLFLQELGLDDYFDEYSEAELIASLLGDDLFSSLLEEGDASELLRELEDAGVDVGSLLDLEPYMQDSYSQDGYSQDSYGQGGYDQDGYDPNGYAQDGYGQDSYGRGGYALDGSAKDGAEAGDSAGRISIENAATGLLYGLRSDGTAYINGHRNAGTLTDLRIPAVIDGHAVTGIEEDAFLGASALVRVTLPVGLEYIGPYAFQECTALQSVALPDSVQTICFDAFYGCTSLESVHLGSGLREMDGNVFSGCPALRAMTVSPANPCFAIRDGILYNTQKNSIVRYPGAVRQEEAFAVPEGVTEVEDSCFFDGNALRRIALPDSVSVIADFAFFGCAQCEQFDLGSVQVIGDCAIPVNGMQALVLPQSVNYLQDMSIFTRSDYDVLHDDFFVIAEDGTYAASWADALGFPRKAPTPQLLAQLQGVEEARIGMQISPEVAVLGDAVWISMQLPGLEGEIVFNMEGEELGSATIENGMIDYIFWPQKAGVYTITALHGMQTIAYAQMAVGGDAPLTVQHIPENCSHEAGHSPLPEIVTVDYRPSAQEDMHIVCTQRRSAWLCNRCKSYHIDEPHSRVDDYELHAFAGGACVCGLTQGTQADPHERYALRFLSGYMYDGRLITVPGEKLVPVVQDLETGERLTLPGTEFALQPIGDAGVVNVLQGGMVQGLAMGSQQIALTYCGEEVDRVDVECTDLWLTGYWQGNRARGTDIVRDREMCGINWERERMCLNSYLAIENYVSVWSAAEGCNQVSFDAYNSGPIAYGVYSYDEQGNLFDRALIGGYWFDGSIAENVKDFFVGTGNMLFAFKDPTNYMNNSKTQIDLRVPEGGSIRFLLPNEDAYIQKINNFTYAMGCISYAYSWASLGDSINSLVDGETAADIMEYLAQKYGDDLADTAIEYAGKVTKWSGEAIAQEVDMQKTARIVLDVLLKVGVDMGEDAALAITTGGIGNLTQAGVSALGNSVWLQKMTDDLISCRQGRGVVWPRQIVLPYN